MTSNQYYQLLQELSGKFHFISMIIFFLLTPTPSGSTHTLGYTKNLLWLKVIPQCALPSLFSRTQCSTQLQNLQVSSMKCRCPADRGRQLTERRSLQQLTSLRVLPWICFCSRIGYLHRREFS